MPIDLFLALRFIRDSWAQTALIASGVGVGVAVIIFLASLIGGLQADLVARTVGSQAHIVATPVRERARSLRRSSSNVVVVERVEEAEQRIRSIDGWQRQMARFGRQPGLVALSPSARGPARVIRGNASENVLVVGVEIRRFLEIIELDAKLVDGGLAVEGSNAVIGSRLAEAIGVEVGDVVRVQAADGVPINLNIHGIFELGVTALDETWVVVSLSTAQSLLELPGGVTTIEASVEELFSADQVAARLRSQSGLKVESWMETNAELLTALRSQSASSWLIQGFVMLAVAIGIASVLVVSVVQRQREIGILRAMGVPRRVVQRVFLIQGAIVGLSGWLIGSGLGAGVAMVFRKFAVGTDGEPLFPIELEPKLFLLAGVLATTVGIASALFPAMRAAKLDPVVAIRV